MAEENQSLRSLYNDAEAKRRSLETTLSSSGATYQENLLSAIATYEECLKVADRVTLFSPNETLEDISSGDLQYLLLHYYLADLTSRVAGGDRKAILLSARASYERFLKLLDNYDILSKADSNLYERYLDAPDQFSTASTTDAQARRDTKIARFREEKALKQKLERLRQDPSALQNDDTALRDLQLTNINLCVYQTFFALESTAQELHILALAPPTQPTAPNGAHSDTRTNDRSSRDTYSDRLDTPSTSLTSKTGPILDSSGRPLRPFTLLDNRQRFQDGVFRPDHNLPTMTIDEYLEEEKKRGGIIEGGGEASGRRPEPDEDNLEKADEETMKARAWDEYTEENPKGSGNTLNMG